MMKYLALVLVLGQLCSSAPVVTKQMVDHINSLGTTWTATTESHIAKLERHEAKRLLGVDMSVQCSKLPEVTHDVDISALPDSFDSAVNWPDCDSMKEIRDQSDCGSCWAFGAVEAMSDRECVFNKRNVRISAEDMNSCSKELMIISCGSCNGGNPACAWTYWASTGVVSEDCFPYSLPSCDHHMKNSTNPCPDDMYPTPKCTSACDASSGKSWSSDKHKGSKSYTVSGEANMMAELYANGPCEVAFTVYEDFLSYESGIYQHKTGASEGGHAVKVVGWGVENGVKYWKIANSWNTHFGEQGFFRILRGSNHCGIEDQAWCGVPVSA